MWIINTKKIYKMKKLILSAGLFLTTLFYAQNTDIKTLIQKANQGDAEAQNNLGVAYYNGEGVDKSYSKTVYWLRKACENFNDEACEFINKIKK